MNTDSTAGHNDITVQAELQNVTSEIYSAKTADTIADTQKQFSKIVKIVILIVSQIQNKCRFMIIAIKFTIGYFVKEYMQSV